MSQHLITRRPVARRCDRCRRLQLEGIDQGLPYRVEPAPLTPHAELTAMLAGRWSYEIVADGLVYRDHLRITKDITRGRPPVFADHQCDNPATATDIDTTYIGTVTQFIATCSPRPDIETDPDTENALFLVTRQLGGRIIAIDNNPPF
jgi:hypothetical protein